jgi:hypothetical protein
MTTVPTRLPPPHFIEGREFYRGFQCGALWVAMSALPAGKAVEQLVYDDVAGWCRVMAERLDLEFASEPAPNYMVLVRASRPERVRTKR